MYVWIWHRLPYGLAGKLVGVTLFLVGVGGLLWYVAFPIVDRHLPNNGVQVIQPGGDSFTAPPTPTEAPSTPVKLPR